MTRVPLARPELAGHVPEGVRAICARLRERGHEAFVVGGAVRDLLFYGGHAGGDWDVATSARPEVVRATFGRVVETGLQHGTVTVVDHERALTVEVTTYRTEGEYADGRRPAEVRFVDRLEEDLARRDFTINAMALEPFEGVLVDPFGGRADLAARLVRAVGEPLERFSEDGLRSMRAVRFAAVLGFDVEPATIAAIGPSLSTFRRVAVERIAVELAKLLSASRPSRGLRPMDETGLLAEVLPSLAAAEPALRARAYARADGCVSDFALRFAALHVELGAEAARLALARLRPRTRDLRSVVAILHGLHRLAAAPVTPASARRLLSEVAEALPAVVALRRAMLEDAGDGEGLLQLGVMEADLDDARRAGVPVTLDALAVDGHDLEPLVGRGPLLGELLGALLELVLESPALNTREALLERARALAGARGAGPSSDE